MAIYGLDQGLPIPPGLIESLQQQRDQLEELLAEDSRRRDEEPPAPAPASAAPNAAAALAGAASRLTQIHQRLARIVAPATPLTLLLIAQESAAQSWLGCVGSVPLVRRLMLVALAFLASLVGLSLSRWVNSADIAKGFFVNHGLSQLMCQAFLLSAAGLGACFSALFQANRYVNQGIFDPRYDASYWSRIVMGLLAGMMMAELVGPQFLSDSTVALLMTSKTDAVEDLRLGAEAFAKPTLAMLGGFSAPVVYRILERLVGAVEALVSTSAGTSVRRREEEIRSSAGAEAAAARIRVASRLSELCGRMGPDTPTGVRHETERLVRQLLNDADDEQGPLGEPLESEHS